eukprot:scaffold33086_cov96-Isochrysis_galbana.AAC.1
MVHLPSGLSWPAAGAIFVVGTAAVFFNFQAPTSPRLPLATAPPQPAARLLHAHAHARARTEHNALPAP